MVHAKEYPTMHYFETPMYPQSMITLLIKLSMFWEFRSEIAFRDVVTRPIEADSVTV